MPATALASSSALEDLIAVTQSAGSTDVTNGFMTDADGNGELVLELDFMLVGGSYPFDNHSSDLEAITLDPTIPPFNIRLVSHCTDNIGHGTVPGEREPWFDWVAEV